jgi:hypothetical protein
MSYASLGEICGAQLNGAPFVDKTKLILNANYGGASYPNMKINGQNNNPQFDGYKTMPNAYSPQLNPYTSSLCSQKK